MNLNRQKLIRAVRAMRGRRIAVVGDWMLDRYTWGAAARLSPEAPVPIVDFASQSECLGGAGNVAVNLAALGAKVVPFGVIGKDAEGEAVLRCASACGIKPRWILTDASRLTTTKTRIIARHQQIVRVDRERREALSKASEEKLIRAIKASLGELDALVLSDYDKGVVTDALAERVLEFCGKSGVPAFVKPKTSRLFAYRGATSIVCNSKEAGFFVTRALQDEDSVEQVGRALLAHFGCASVVITMGENGLTLFEEPLARHLHIPATSFEVSFARFGKPGVDREASGRQVFDVTGAGDTVLALLALGVSAGAALADAAVLANAAAGVVVGKLGTSSVEPEELLGAVKELR